MTPDELDDLVMSIIEEALDPTFNKWVGINTIANNLNYGFMGLRLEPPPAVLKLDFLKKMEWFARQARWSLTRLELAGLIEGSGRDQFRKLSILDQLARSVATKKEREKCKKKRRKS